MQRVENHNSWTFVRADGSLAAEVGPSRIGKVRYVLLYPGHTKEDGSEACEFAAIQTATFVIIRCGTYVAPGRRLRAVGPLPGRSSNTHM